MKHNKVKDGKLRIRDVILLIAAIGATVLLYLFVKQVQQKQSKEQWDLVSASMQQEQTEHTTQKQIDARSMIAINEIGRTDKNHVWIELYNTSNYDVELNGYQFMCNRDHMLHTISESVIIPTKGFYVADIKVDQDIMQYLWLKTPEEEVVDSLLVPSLEVNEVFGREEDGGDDLYYLIGTKSESNANGSVKAMDIPQISRQSGFYEKEFTVEIIARPELDIYYTLDGSTPTAQSEKYVGPFTIQDASLNENVYSAYSNISTTGASTPLNKINKATVLNAVAINSKGELSDTASATYFVDYTHKTTLRNTPIISIVSDPKNLFDYWEGIYVSGSIYEDALITGNNKGVTANYLENWEKDATIQFFESDGVLSYEDQIKLSIFQDEKVNEGQKSLKLSKLSYDKNIDSTLVTLLNPSLTEDDLILSNNRMDNVVKLRSKLISELMVGRNVCLPNIVLCSIYIDGEYWGVYSIYEEYTTDYVADYYDLDAKNIAIINNGTAIDNEEDVQALYFDLHNFIRDTDFEDQNNYEKFCEMVDIQSLIDCYCCQIYIGNNLWLNDDYYIWRTKDVTSQKYNDGKWRWMLSSMDYSAGIDIVTNYSINSFLRGSLQSDVLFSKLIRNKSFQEQFSATFVDISNTNFSPEVVKEKLGTLSTTYMDAVAASSGRFLNYGTTDVFVKSTEKIQTFFDNRQEYILAHLKKQIEEANMPMNQVNITEEQENTPMDQDIIQNEEENESDL